jgi:twitching motility protein PilT
MNFIQQKIASLLARRVAFSDIHIEAAEPLRYRRPDGLVAEDRDAVEDGDVLEFLDFVRGAEEWKQRVDAGGGQYDFSLTLEGVRFRCNLHCFGGSGRHGLVLRKLDPRIPDLLELGLPASVLQFLQRRSGLLLVTGPTGSGKSTTLASFIDYINTQWPYKIITIEDPIEYVHVSKRSMILQREVGRDVASFSAGLVASFRQDPDCILIGEIRDKETISTALAAAEAGHLVLATLHTAGAAKTVDRITDFFSGEEKTLVRSVLSSVLLGVISQALVPRRDGSGRVLAYEIMRNIPAIATHIREGKTHHIANAMSTAGIADMQLMHRTLAVMAKAGVIAREEAKRSAYDAQELEKEMEAKDAVR